MAKLAFLAMVGVGGYNFGALGVIVAGIIATPILIYFRGSTKF